MHTVTKTIKLIKQTHAKQLIAKLRYMKCINNRFFLITKLLHMHGWICSEDCTIGGESWVKNVFNLGGNILMSVNYVVKLWR